MVNQSSFRSNTYHLVIEEFDKNNNLHITEKMLGEYLRNEMRVSFYAFIKHDKDLDDLQKKERVHFHIVIALNTSYSKNTIVCGFANGLSCNKDIVSCRRIKSFCKSVQYLLHRNDKDKYQYDYLDIWTNDVNELNLCLYRNTSSYELDIEYLHELCLKSSDLTTIYLVLGMSKSRQYRSIILDMYKEAHVDKLL